MFADHDNTRSLASSLLDCLLGRAMTDDNKKPSGLSASQSSAAAVPDVSWSFDVGAAVGVDAPVLVSADDVESEVNETVASATPLKPRRGFSRLSPKKDSKAVKRREKLRKIRRDLKSSGASTAASESPTTPSSKNTAKVKSASRNADEVKSSKAKAAKKSSPKSVPTEQVVRSQVVAEIASLVSQNLKTSTKTKTKRKVGEQKKVPKPESKLPKQEPLIEAVAPVFSLSEPAPPEEERYTEWLRRVVLKNKWMSVFTTCYVHWLILLALAAILVNGPENAASLLINATFASDEPMEEASFEVVVADPQPIPEPQELTPQPVADRPATLQESNITLDESVLDALAPEAAAAGSDSDESAESDSRPAANSAPAPNPAPRRAISKGSFSVWTEPTSPQAGEAYRIVIQVCLPNGLKRYNVADLQGVVVGSDGYRKPIPGFLRGFLPVEDGYARLIIPIVSADEKVKDTVFIRSRVLKETQKLLIEFESAM